MAGQRKRPLGAVTEPFASAGFLIRGICPIDLFRTYPLTCVLAAPSIAYVAGFFVCGSGRPHADQAGFGEPCVELLGPCSIDRRRRSV